MSNVSKKKKMIKTINKINKNADEFGLKKKFNLKFFQKSIKWA